jgi:hypothetical protein
VGVGASDVKFGLSAVSNEEIPTPLVQSLSNYPNPFNPETKISFSLSQASQVGITIFNTKGQKIKQLYSGNLASGAHNLIWNGTDNIGNAVASGVYFYRLRTKQGTVSRKMLLVK